jgi:hypothetical protein
VPLHAALRFTPLTHTRQSLAKALITERLEQIVHRAHLERLQGVGVIGGHKDDHGQIDWIQYTRQLHAVESIDQNGMDASRLRGEVRVSLSKEVDLPGRRHQGA